MFSFFFGDGLLLPLLHRLLSPGARGSNELLRTHVLMSNHQAIGGLVHDVSVFDVVGDTRCLVRFRLLCGAC